MIIKTQKVPKKEPKPDDIISKFCYYFPQYKYHEAKKLPYIRISNMLKTAERENAYFMYNIVRACVAPHSKKGAVQDIINDLRKIIEN